MTMYEKYCQLEIDGRWIGKKRIEYGVFLHSG